MIELVKAQLSDCERLHKMQTECFADLLEKYKDYDTNPGSEPVEKIIGRVSQPETDYYIAYYDGAAIGAIRIYNNSDGYKRISPIFVLPEYCNRGLAQEMMHEAERRYPDAAGWLLETIKQEPKLRHLYEKMGYVLTGRGYNIREGMDIVQYVKQSKN